MTQLPRRWFDGPSSRLLRVVIVTAGILLLQFGLYGPSLLGRAVLLPLSVLAAPTCYLPPGAIPAGLPRADLTRIDILTQYEMQRQFAAAELRAGRLPLWQPYHFGGVVPQRSVFAPFFLAEILTPHPIAIAWAQLLLAVTAGLGLYGFCRRVLDLSFGAAAVAAWCYPMTGFFVLWSGFPLTTNVVWFPWLLWAIDATIRRPGPGPIAGVGATTALTLVGGHLDYAGLVLLASGFFALARLFQRWREAAPPAVLVRAAGWVAAGWLAGFLLSAPYTLPYAGYLRMSGRLAGRAAAQEQERPPQGWPAVMEALIPDIDGANREGSLLLSGNQMESGSTAYAGLVAALLAAPLAAAARRSRGAAITLGLLVVIGLGWSAGLPGWVHLLRLPGANLLSYNRFVFACGFALTALAALGLDTLLKGEAGSRRWFVVPFAVCLALAGWCAFRAFHPPEPVATVLGRMVAGGENVNGIATAGDVAAVQASFRQVAIAGAAAALAAALGWFLLRRAVAPRLVGAGLALGLVGELWLFAVGRVEQADPALWFPRIPALEAVARATPGRAIGALCLPATLLQSHGLSDVRGYDGSDPARWTELVHRTADPRFVELSYARTQSLVPALRLEPPGDVRLPPLLDLLGVRWVILRGRAPAGIQPRFESPDYWVMENVRTLPRTFVPQSVVLVADAEARLAAMTRPDFDPRAQAFVEEPLELPPACRGTARITAETPTFVAVAADLETAGLLVLADRWDPGWKATIDGRPAAIRVVNHALRGVLLPAGTSTVEFRYAPDAFRLGLALAAVAAAALLTAALWPRRRAG